MRSVIPSRIDGEESPAFRGGSLALCGARDDTCRRYTIALLLVVLVTLPLRAGEALRFDSNWKFHFGDAASPQDDFGYGAHADFAKAGSGPAPTRFDFNDRDWQSVNLPHDWAVDLPVVNSDDSAVKDHGFKPVGRLFPKTSIGWYRRTFSIGPEEAGKRIVLKFDGVFRDSMVWVNGFFLGRHQSGYTSFSYDITDYVHSGDQNVVCVRVDAGDYEGWFYEGAGIYRHVWLLLYPPMHIPLYGMFVSTSNVATSAATVNVATDLVNESDTPASTTLTSTVTGAGSASTPLTLAPHERKHIEQSIEVHNPRLWSLDAPNLYTLVSTLGSDRSETTFGIRTLRFDPNGGFFLNGQHVEIKGTCDHQDHAGVGVAVPDALWEFRIRKLKEMGSNAIRTSHNAPAPELLDACDRLGMLVLDENRSMGSTPQVLADLRSLILRDRNHPSVFLWSLGNEEWRIQNTPTGAAVASAMKRVQRELDPTRLSTYAADNGVHYDGINSVVDVRGVNYIGRGEIDQYHKEHPDQPVIGTEEASTYSTRGVYANDSAHGFLSELDINAPDYGATAERWWTFYAGRPWLAGAFVWTGFDYRGEPSPFGWPNTSSQYGILDTCGFPKNNFFYYQAWWSNQDVLHIAPHWNWSGKEGQPIDVWVDSNADWVELFLNGRSLGRKTMPRNSHLEWKVPYAPGTLTAKGMRNGRLLTAKVETTGSPTGIRLDATTIDDLAIVTVTVVDSRNRQVPDADSLVHFDVEGDGKIIGLGNGDPTSHEPDKGAQRRLFNGKCQVIVQAAGPITLRATSEGLKDGTVTIDAK